MKPLIIFNSANRQTVGSTGHTDSSSKYGNINALDFQARIAKSNNEETIIVSPSKQFLIDGKINSSGDDENNDNKVAYFIHPLFPFVKLCRNMKYKNLLFFLNQEL